MKSTPFRMLLAPTNPPQLCIKIFQTSSPHLKIWLKRLLTFMVSNSNHIRFGIKMRFYLTLVVTSNTLFESTSGTTPQVSVAAKLWSMNLSGWQYSSSYRQMDSYSCLLLWLINHPQSKTTWTMVSLETGHYMQHCLVTWSRNSGWIP